MIALFIILQALDAMISGYILMYNGAVMEANPFVSILIEHYGVVMPMLSIKVLTTAFIIIAIEKTYYPVWLVVNLIMAYVVYHNITMLF